MLPYLLGWPLVCLYGVVLLLGGVMGYVKARSVPSLAAGIICGAIVLLCGIRSQWHYSPLVVIVIALFLTFLMGRRYLVTRKAMPALLIVVLSLIVAIAQIISWLVWGLGSEPLL